MKLRAFLQKHLDDMLLAGGAGLIVYATAQINTIAAFYVTGALLMTAGVLIGIGNGRRS